MSAAFAIAAEAERCGLTAEVLDIMNVSPAAFTAWYRGGYEKLVRDRPAFWGHLYRSSDRPLFNYGFQTVLDYVFTTKIQDAMERIRPDWVVCTHSLPQPRLVPLRRKFGFKVAIVVTDLYVHRMWLRGRPDHYFVPQEWSREVLKRRRPALGRNCTVTGIPIHPVFGEPGPDRDWSGEKVAIVSSGGIGGGPLGDALDHVVEAGWRAKVITGRNEAVRLELVDRFAGQERVDIVGGVDQPTMAGLMKSCHLLMSKPGGLTTFESLATGIPFCVYWPFLIPGQEEGNAQFLRDIGAGVIVRKESEIALTLGGLSEDKLRAMSAAAKDHALPQAARSIVDELVRMTR
jgi:processive 1,2-diacylglycerol beta-glucosyltransferase